MIPPTVLPPALSAETGVATHTSMARLPAHGASKQSTPPVNQSETTRCSSGIQSTHHMAFMLSVNRLKEWEWDVASELCPSTAAILSSLLHVWHWRSASFLAPLWKMKPLVVDGREHLRDVGARNPSSPPTHSVLALKPQSILIRVRSAPHLYQGPFFFFFPQQSDSFITWRVNEPETERWNRSRTEDTFTQYWRWTSTFLVLLCHLLHCYWRPTGPLSWNRWGSSLLSFPFSCCVFKNMWPLQFTPSL